ncbi:hypothetical protein CA85_46210 [Allorhodopirellula solitaria]|uniref:Uncharacterized protein n=1 Tax=Allorhodopirellula solitaria TaxID=2527987 RepID=A0A5C5X0B2_9BACT|nr:hypothetical protein CA85_46210 [Allorhodopirellula solitaria]
MGVFYKETLEASRVPGADIAKNARSPSRVGEIASRVRPDRLFGGNDCGRLSLEIMPGAERDPKSISTLS